MRILIAIIMALSLQAETFVHLTSFHSIHPDYGEWNNKNYGVGYRFDNNIKTGFYKNSDFKTTAYVGYDYFLTEHIGVQAGLVTGYESPVGCSVFMEMSHVRLDLIPILTPTGRYGVALGASIYF